MGIERNKINARKLEMEIMDRIVVRLFEYCNIISGINLAKISLISVKVKK